MDLLVKTIVGFAQRDAWDIRHGLYCEKGGLCELLSIVSTPLLLDHVRREAGKFLDEMEVLLPEVRKCTSCLGQTNQSCQD